MSTDTPSVEGLTNEIKLLRKQILLQSLGEVYETLWFIKNHPEANTASVDVLNTKLGNALYRHIGVLYLHAEHFPKTLVKGAIGFGSNKTTFVSEAIEELRQFIAELT